MNITQTTQDQSKSLSLFYNSNPNSTVSINPWIIHNYPLGNGSWGIVNIGSHEKNHTVQVAIKTIKRFQYDQDNLKQIKFEIKVSKSLNHPNLMKLLDWIIDCQTVSPDQGKIHLIMELIIGGDLFSYLENNGFLREDEIRWISWQIIDGLKYIHKKGIVHRDIKPENILLHTSCAYPRILLADFGCSSSKSSIFSELDEGNSHLRTIDRQGTREYFSYDILKAMRAEECFVRKVYTGTKKEVGEIWWREEMGMDVWAMGVTLYFAATHQPPFYSGKNYQKSPQEVLSFVTQPAISPQCSGWMIDDDIEMGDSLSLGTNREASTETSDPFADFPSPPRESLFGISDSLATENITDDVHNRFEGLYMRSITPITNGTARKDNINNRSGTIKPTSQYNRDDTMIPRERDETIKSSAKQQHLSSAKDEVSGRNGELDSMIIEIEQFKKLKPDKWPEGEIWSRWSKEGEIFDFNN
nr:serine/threonine protein kinase [Kwoniella pini CBS 10737]OCF46973.1 serine/threonine protein kinase [Kwoniella pini CBS 10737]